ncbi:MAG: isoprenylcysteine carboxylmethyltransferase family protein [Vicinamibacterales bacterium]
MRTMFAWIGALLFAASLLSFVVVYGNLLRLPAPATGAPIWPAVLFDVTLFTIFALHHSVMARTGAKAWISRIVSPELERSVYVWIASLLFIAVCWLWRPLPGIAWALEGPLQWLGFGVQLAGLALTERASGIIGVWELAGVRQARRDQPVEFKVTGPFGLVRHPIYFGWLLIVFGTPEMTCSRLLFAVVSSAYLVVAIPLEEASLVQAFGEKYRAYQRQVRSRLVPGVW